MAKGACSPACAAFAGMLDHSDRHLAHLVAFLERACVRDDTLILVLSDNGASQEGGRSASSMRCGRFNYNPEPMAEKLRRIDDIGSDRGSPVSQYEQPLEFTGRLSRLTVVMHEDLTLDGEGIGQAMMARQ